MTVMTSAIESGSGLQWKLLGHFNDTHYSKTIHIMD